MSTVPLIKLFTFYSSKIILFQERLNDPYDFRDDSSTDRHIVSKGIESLSQTLITNLYIFTTQCRRP